jgi:hypothetical protein
VRFLLFFLLISCFSCQHYYKKYYTEPLQYHELAKAKVPFDALIVPGFPHYKDSITPVVAYRVAWAKYLYEKGWAKNLIFSGGAVYTPYYEGKIMAMLAIQMGVPAQHVFVDTLAEHSIENIYFSEQVGSRYGFKTFAYGTDVVQSSFLYAINNHRYQIPVSAIPILYDSIQVTMPVVIQFDQQLAYRSDFVSITERENAWQRLKGTRGIKIKRIRKAERRAKAL